MFEVKRLNEGSILFKEGAIGAEAFLVKKGRIRISRRNGGSKEVLAELGPGEIFGEMAQIIPSLKRTAQAESITFTEVVVINKMTFENILNNLNSIARHMIISLADRLVKSNNKEPGAGDNQGSGGGSPRI